MIQKDQNQQLTGPHRTNDIRRCTSGWFGNERLVITMVLGLVLGFAIFDFIEDRSKGASSAVLIADVSDLFLPILLLLYIWRCNPLAPIKNNRSLKQTVSTQRSGLELWRGRASTLLKGLSASINQQFDQCVPSNAEKQVALLLLKGLSLKDIAKARGVFERTVCQQATRLQQGISAGARRTFGVFSRGLNATRTSRLS